MLYTSAQTLTAIILVSTLSLMSIYFHFVQKKHKVALVLLLCAGFMARLFMASIDPFLQDWDERFHALVAKNLMNFPFQPMMMAEPIMPYKIEDWCCNHIWLHKQPLFLWQMALSMKIFGVHEISMRLPSVILGTISIYWIYDTAKLWTKNTNIAFLSGLLATLSYYQLELTAGRFMLGQNDVAFAFYVTTSIWAFVKYLHTTNPLKWAIWIGVFVGAAVLNKWLTGILIFGGWGLYVLVSSFEKWQWKPWLHLLLAIGVSLLVFLPWQLYIMHYFPIESALEYANNTKHIFEVIEGHEGDSWFHWEMMKTMYGRYLLVFLPFGLVFMFWNKSISKKLTLALVTMVLVIYGFFSIMVQTKMPSFTFPIHSIVWIVMAAGLWGMYSLLNQWRINKYVQIAGRAMALLTISFIAIYTLKPWQIIDCRSANNVERNKKIHNAMVYKTMDLSGDLKNRVILNCKSFENVELMFYQEVNAYHWYPEQHLLDSLLLEGHQFAAFKNHNDQHLPAYITENEDILIIDKTIK